MNTNMPPSTSKKEHKLLDAIEDRFSNLPDNLLLHILSFLPTTKQVIHTSVLSTRWKYIWISIPNFYFPTNRRLRNIGDRQKVLVDNVFSLHDSSNIQKFHLDLDLDDDYRCSSRLEAWISTLMKHRLQEFDLHCPDYIGDFTFSISLFKSLKILKVIIPSFLPVPSLICFPNLKALEFSLVKFSVELSTQHQHVSFSFPLLEDFGMWDCEWLEIKTVNIYAPSLVNLRVGDDLRVAEAAIESGRFRTKIDIDAPGLVSLSFEEYLCHDYYLSDLPSIADATFSSFDYLFRTHCLVNWVTAVSNVRNLTLCACCIKVNWYFKTFSDTCYLTSTEMFSNVIHLSVGSSSYEYSGEHLINLLDRMPNIESLYIDVFHDLPDGDEWSKRAWMKEQTPHCNLSKLKSVEIYYFDGNDNVLYLVSYLLARTLEKMNIRFSLEYFAVGKNKNDISKWLLRLPRGSPGTEVFIWGT